MQPLVVDSAANPGVDSHNGSGKSKRRGKKFLSPKRPDSTGATSAKKSSKSRFGDGKKKGHPSRASSGNLERKPSTWSLSSQKSLGAHSDISAWSDSVATYSSNHHPDFMSLDSLASLDGSIHSVDSLVQLTGMAEMLTRTSSSLSAPAGPADLSGAKKRGGGGERSGSRVASRKSVPVAVGPDDKALPEGWLMMRTGDGRPYFINKTRRITTWLDPRTKRPVAATQKPGFAPANVHDSCNVPLPEGWEMGFTKSGTRYYIDHINRRTTWEDPRGSAPETQRQRLRLQQLKIANSEIKVQIEMIRKQQAILEQEMLRSASPETVKLAKAKSQADAYNLLTLKAQHDTVQRQIESRMVALQASESAADGGSMGAALSPPQPTTGPSAGPAEGVAESPLFYDVTQMPCLGLDDEGNVVPTTSQRSSMHTHMEHNKQPLAMETMETIPTMAHKDRCSSPQSSSTTTASPPSPEEAASAFTPSVTVDDEDGDGNVPMDPAAFEDLLNVFGQRLDEDLTHHRTGPVDALDGVCEDKKPGFILDSGHSSASMGDVDEYFGTWTV